MRFSPFGLGSMIAVACMATATANSAPEDTKTEVVWTAQLKGISGWSAAKTAQSARAALAKLDDIEVVHVDTTARAILRMKKDKSPDKDTLNGALKSVSCSIASLEKVQVPLAVEAVEISIEGLGWQTTAKSIREVLEKVDGVIVALPDGADHKVLVHTQKAGALTETSAKQLIENAGKFKVTAFVAKKIEPKA